MAKLSADASSPTPADSTSDTDSRPLLLPAKGEAVSSTSLWDEEATGKGILQSSASELGAGLRQGWALRGPMTAANLELPEKRKICL